MAVWVAVAGTATATDVSRRVRATGLAVVREGDQARAFTDARRLALREAVEQGVGVLVSSTTRALNFAVIEDRILTATHGYVRSYQVVSRGLQADGAYAVTIDAEVDLAHLQTDLDALALAVDVAGAPRLGCGARVEADGGEGESAALAGLLCAELATMTDALDVAVLAGAAAGEVEIQVAGRARLEDVEAPIPYADRTVATSGLHAAAADLDVQVTWTDEAQPVRKLNAVGRGVGISATQARDRALEAAARQIGASLRQAVAEDLGHRAYSHRVVEVIVEGVGGGEAVTAVPALLRAALAPLETLRTRRVEDGSGVYEVRSSEAAFGLARRLSQRGMAGRAVGILQVTPNRLRLSLGPGPAASAETDGGDPAAADMAGGP